MCYSSGNDAAFVRPDIERGVPGPAFVRTPPVKKIGKARNGALLRAFEPIGGRLI